jgi:hypothetical protein
MVDFYAILDVAQKLRPTAPLRLINALECHAFRGSASQQSILKTMAFRGARMD